MKQAVIKPKSVVNLQQLKEYDRFTFLTGKKIVWQVVSTQLITDFKGDRKLYTNCIDDNMNKKRFDSGRSVMFLRRNDPNVSRRRFKASDLIDY